MGQGLGQLTQSLRLPNISVTVLVPTRVGTDNKSGNRFLGKPDLITNTSMYSANTGHPAVDKTCELGICTSMVLTTLEGLPICISVAQSLWQGSLNDAKGFIGVTM